MIQAARLLLLLVALLPGEGLAQAVATEQGRPFFIQRFTAQDYGQNQQNWAVVQDAREVIYVANRTGLLEYDGRTWRTLRVPGQFVRSLATDAAGRVYVGGVGEMGMLAPDSTGQMEYQSLVAHVADQDRKFADVWTVHAVGDHVYFQSFDRVFRWDGTAMSVWKATTRFHKAFAVQGAYYVRQDDVGLAEIDGETLALVPDGERFAREPIDMMLPLGDDAALVVTRNEGLLVRRGEAYRPFATEADAYLRSQRVYHGAAMPGGVYALTTFSGTVVLLDAVGRVLRILGEDVGLNPDELVLYAYPDHQGGLWLALDTGLLRVDVPTPLTSFGQGQGLPGAVYDTYRFEGSLYAATSQGLFRLQSSTGIIENPASERAHFRPVAGLNVQSWSVVGVGGRLLVAANDGVYEVSDGRARQIMPGRAFVLEPSRLDPEVVYVGMKDGLAVLRLRAYGWEQGGEVQGVNIGEVRSLTEEADGSLWVGSPFDGIARVWLEGRQSVHVEHYGIGHGLPEGAIAVYRLGGGVVFQSPEGLFRLDEQTGRAQFVRDVAVNTVVEPDGVANFLINSTQPGRLWMIKDGRIQVFAAKPEGGYEDVTPPVLHLSGIPERVLYIEPSGVAWVAGEQGLLRYDPAVEKDYAAPYPALVRRVIAGQDSLIFSGAMSESYATPEIAYEDNNFLFTFSAPTFNAPGGTVYQYWLEGFDDGWSKWMPEARKEYTNLPEASYRFHVRARNAQGVVGREDVYAFDVLPPWYRTWWAYALYVSFGVLIVWSYGNLRIRQHRRMLAHEQQVNQRLDTANARLREANERLHQADKLKDDFLANTSHELRTPLTAILGFAAVLQEELEGELRDFAVMIRRGGERLFDTVDALLDMARLQADMMDIEPVDLDLTEEARGVARTLEPLAQEKGLYLKVLPESKALPAHMDRSCIERVLVNLIGNAVKFTDEGGVTVLLDASDDEVRIVVQDTGIGIRKEFLPDLFTEFKQESSGYARMHEGNGLGLAITRRIVHMLGGEIDVDSRVGGGTTFRICLPRYDRREVDTSRSEPAATPMLPENTRLLLVEDAERPHPRLGHLLGPHCEFDVVTGADEGLAAARRGSYDALLIDGHLALLSSGQPLLEAVRLLPGHADVPAIAVTGFTMPGDRERFIGLGYTGHIGKPFTGRRLLLLMESVLQPAEREPVGEE